MSSPAFLGEQQSRAWRSQEHVSNHVLTSDPLSAQDWSILPQARNNTRQDRAPAQLVPLLLLYCCCPELSLHHAQVTSLKHQRGELVHILTNLKDKRD